MQKPSGIGGQAVMEGIMMRHGGEYAIAVRKPDGEIIVKKEDYKTTIPLKGIEKIPILRGVSAFIDSMVIGISCLMYSASFIEDEEEDSKDRKEKKAKAGKKETEENTEAAEKQKTADVKEAGEKKESGPLLTPFMMTMTVVFAVAFSVGLFILLPYFLASILRRFGVSEVAVSLAEAVLRLVIFLTYMLLISRMKDIQRVFMYHGSEHKCINCIEHGLPLTVENVMKSSRQHKRCGTSFLLIVIMISVVFFLILGLLGITSPLLRFGIRLLMIPVIAGVAYEFIRYAGKSDSACANFLSKPGLLLQKLVTREPDEKQVEVAIAAVEAVFDWKNYLAENFPESAAS